MLAYLDVGLAIYAALLIRSPLPTAMLRALADHSLAVVFLAMLVSASLWPLIPLAWLFNLHGSRD